MKRGLELIEIRVAVRAESLGVFQTLSDVVKVSPVPQDPHEVVCARNQLLHVDVSGEIAHFLDDSSAPDRFVFVQSLT